MGKAKMYYLFGVVILALIVGIGIYISTNGKHPGDKGPDISSPSPGTAEKQGQQPPVTNGNNNTASGNQNSQNKNEGVLVGFTAPNFQLSSITGESVKLSDYKDKPVLINFWRLGTNESVDQLRVLQSLNSSLGKNKELVILAVNYREGSAVKEYVSSKKYDFTNLLDADGKVAESYKIATFPTAFLLKPGEEISKIWTSPYSENEILEQLNEMKNE